MGTGKFFAEERWGGGYDLPKIQTPSSDSRSGFLDNVDGSTTSTL